MIAQLAVFIMHNTQVFAVFALDQIYCPSPSRCTLLASVAQLAGKTSGPPGGGVAADAAKGGAHGEAGGEVGDIVKRLFKKLYAKVWVRLGACGMGIRNEHGLALGTHAGGQNSKGETGALLVVAKLWSPARAGRTSLADNAR